MAKAPRKRADILLLERGLVESRAKAQALIMAGHVYAGAHEERKLSKAGEPLAEDTPLSVKGQEHPWVSRGGMKLAHGMAHFGLSAEGRTALDIGASTGGFTDVLLHAGARHVLAVDVGHGQLAWKIRADPRVTVREKLNARNLTLADLGPEALLPNGQSGVDIAVCDASFISLKTVFTPALNLVRPGGWAIGLIKPQFEAGRADIGAKGVVRDPAVHQRVCDEACQWLAELDGWTVLGVEASPITGPEGNREFLLAGRKNAAPQAPL
ncbi:TlyA family RNA methyltransferase [Formicincola oecophyllae]|uniref:TlyA family RNA methyltransferase n=1 Tax=Formicincola oecophyllae TaxID=2558361 RepID=A0A4Y6U6T0_9PROT|nr:TlyA family RNA methyltransferase [Formicincola oecophyllae]QDH13072.1 TlyA family RNA methyltransferase [Formicincola oecophyllae]